MQITVASTSALTTALASAQGGDTILLAAGTYGRVGLSNLTIPGGVTIASADAAHPVVIAGIELNNVSGLTFRDIEVHLNTRTMNVVQVVLSDDVHFDHVEFQDVPGSQEAGVLIRNSSNVSIDNSEIHDVRTAIATVQSSNVTISGNQLHDLQGDGIQTTGTSNVTITGNYFTNFFPSPGDHPDAIQFFTLGTTASATNLTITNNTYVRGSGSATQGIFLGNEINLAYQNVTITGNKIVGAMYNGIAVSKADGVVIGGNIVQSYTDIGSSILLQYATNSQISNNQATNYIYNTGNTGLIYSGNATLTPATVGDTSILGVTLPVFSPPPPPPVVISPPPPPSVASPPPPPPPGGVSPPPPPPTHGATSTEDATIRTFVSGQGTATSSSGASHTTQGVALEGDTVTDQGVIMIHDGSGVGSAGADSITGGAGDNDLRGGAGADVIVGGTGSNYLLGEDGSDSLVGGAASDEIHGDAGNDLAHGGDGADAITGGDGDDAVYGDEGSDLLYGNIGADTVDGGAGDDAVVGGQGDDEVSGGDGADRLFGQLGDDTADGGAGADSIIGGQGNDVLNGGAGDDWLTGDRGSDTLTGGAGADTFHAFSGAGLDRITDFHADEGDRVQVDAGAHYVLAQLGSDTVIIMDGGSQVVLVDVQLSSLKPGWIFEG